jgi:hypothetical protein
MDEFDVSLEDTNEDFASVSALTSENNHPKRRSRAQTACQPCRARKVKCTLGHPCQTCVERGQPEACIYTEDLPAKRINTGSAYALDWGTPSKQDTNTVELRISGLENLIKGVRDEIAGLRADLQKSTGSQARRITDEQPTLGFEDEKVPAALSMGRHNLGEFIYLGGNSVPAMVQALTDHNSPYETIRGITEQTILPIFGLDNESATYPFVDLWGLPHGSPKRIELLFKLLPSTDADCLQIFKQYRDTAHVIFPGIVNIAQFENELLEFLVQRAQIPFIAGPGTLTEQVVCGKSMHWLGLLFAALASGSQCLDSPRKERTMQAQVYGKASELFLYV